MRRQMEQEESRSRAFEAAAERLASLLGEVLHTNQRLQKESLRVRSEIMSELAPVIETMPAEERGAILSQLVLRIQDIFDKQGSPKVELSGGCAGAAGVGIRASEGGSYAGVCVTGSLAEGPTGGGVEGGFTY